MINKPTEIKKAIIGIWVSIGILVLNILIDKWIGNITINMLVLMLLMTAIICIFPYKISNKSKAARFIFSILVGINFLIFISGYGFSMLTIDIIFYLISLPLTIYILVLLYSQNANNWFNNIELVNQDNSLSFDNFNPMGKEPVKTSSTNNKKRNLVFEDNLKRQKEIYKKEKLDFENNVSKEEKIDNVENLNFEEKVKKKEEVYKKRYEEFKKENIEVLEVTNKELKPELSYLEKKEKVDDYEKKVAGYYKLDGYSIHLNGIKKNKLDGGIDVICKKDDEVILIQCKNWNHENKYKITHKNIKEFHSNCIKYIEENNLIKENVKLKYIVPNRNVFKACAIEIFRNDYYNCRYEILEF